MKQSINIGLILDGNRRWSEKHNLPHWKGYKKGLDVLEEFLEWTKKHDNIKHITLYIMSNDNYTHRPTDEIQYIFNRMKDKLLQLKRDEDNIKVKVWGDWKSIHDSDLINTIDDVMNATKSYVKTTLHLLFNWFTNEDGKNIDIPSIDLLIRTGGCHRLSGFIPFKCSYAELYFLDRFFPDCTEKDWERALKWYEDQQRNFGV